MKTIIHIGKAELKTLFYSPIAWLILVIFTFQCSLTFTNVFDDKVRTFVNNFPVYKATLMTFGTDRGLFSVVQQYIYLYIPLLTMGVFSREYSSGSIKLLFSSPVKTRDIIWGKYLALIVFSIVLLSVLLFFSIFGALAIQNVDYGIIFSGLLGLFLLMAAYNAIGVFMSSLSSYTVVSAMGTLAVFALLSYVRNVGQDVELVRDITYWMAISGRTDTFIVGLITSEEVLYFLIVLLLFIGFTYIKLTADRKYIPKTKLVGMYLSYLIFFCFLGYLSALPKLKSYVDLSAIKANTLTASSQDVISKLDGDLTITSYINMFEDDHWWMLPRSYKDDVKRFEQYTRFKPDIKMKYVYYYHEIENSSILEQFKGLSPKVVMDSVIKLNNHKFPIHSYDEIKDQVDLEAENFRSVRRITNSAGKESFLRFYDDMERFPSEAEMTAAFKRIALDKLPTVGFISGHNERGSTAEDDRGYNMFAQEKRFRYSLVNQGLNFENVNLKQPIPKHIHILLLAEPRKAISAEELKNLDQYIAEGGNMLIAAEPGKQEEINPVLERFGLHVHPGVLVSPSEKYPSTFLLMGPTDESKDFNYHMLNVSRRKLVLPFTTTAPLEILLNKDFKVQTLFTSDSLNGWNELETVNFIDDTAKYNPAAGELKMPYPTVVALSRNVGQKEQKILVTSDADWLSNAELMTSRKDINSANFSLFNSAFYWLTDEELPIDMRRPTWEDRTLRISGNSWDYYRFFFNWGLFSILALGGTLLLIRRKGK